MDEKKLVVLGAVGFTLLSSFAVLYSVKAGIALFAGGVLVAVVFFKPFWGLLLYLAMLYLRPQEFVRSLQNKPIMLLLAILVLLTLIIHGAIQKRKLLALELRQGIFMIAFFAIIILSQLQRFYIGGARTAFDTFLPVFLLFFMIVNLITSFAEMKRTYHLLLVMTIFLAANGILQYHRGVDIAGQDMFDGRIRWIGIFADPNDLGLTILAFTPFALLKILRKNSAVLPRLGYVLILGVLLYALYLTNSRGTFIGFLIVLTYLAYRKWGIARALLIAAVLGVALFAVGPSRMADLSVDEESASGRIIAWAQGLDLLKWRPILGVGYGSFTEYHIITAHNSVVLCMAELGLIGLYTWLLLISTSFHEMLLIEKRGEESEHAFYAQALQLSMISFFSAAFFLSRTYNEVLYIILGLCAILSHLSQERFGYKVPFLSRNTALMVLFISIGFIALIKVIVIV
jgi:putative inorganic carbon (HCO3(-)) transporter